MFVILAKDHHHKKSPLFKGQRFLTLVIFVCIPCTKDHPAPFLRLHSFFTLLFLFTFRVVCTKDHPTPLLRLQFFLLCCFHSHSIYQRSPHPAFKTTGFCQTTLGAVQAVVRYPWVLYRLFSDNPGCCIGCCQTTLLLFRLSESPDAVGCQKTRVLLSDNPYSV